MAINTGEKPRSREAPQGERRRRLSVEARRAALVAAAMAMFRQRPYADVGTEEVARAAGVSQSLIFHYFPTKSDLFVAALEEELETLWRSLSEASARSRDPAERVVASLNAYFDYAQQRGDRFAAVLRGQEASVGPKVSELVDALRDRLVALMQSDMAQEFSTEQLGEARLLRAGLRGWLGFVQELALDYNAHGDLTRQELVDTSMRALLAVAPAPDPGPIPGQ